MPEANLFCLNSVRINFTIYLNYSVPFKLTPSEYNKHGFSKPEYKIENVNFVHGYCGLSSCDNPTNSSPIIFGIDNDGININSENYRFTKTARKLSLDSRPIFQTTTALPDRNDVTQIVFYGHSLSTSDYAYFQSIFDYYDIYNNPIKLIFGYSLLNDPRTPKIEDESKAINRHTIIVSKLVNEYAQKTFANSYGNIANNLLHMLELQNRIVLRKF